MICNGIGQRNTRSCPATQTGMIWLQTIPIVFSTNAPKQNTFAIVASLSSIPIRFGCCTATSFISIMWWSCCLPYAGPVYARISWPSGMICTFICEIGWDTAVMGGCGLARVFLILCLGCFMWPFTVTGLGFKYLRINVSLMSGHFFKYPHHVAFNREEICGLHNAWCANLPALARVVTECVNIAIAGWWGGWGAQPSPGPGHGNVCVST